MERFGSVDELLQFAIQREEEAVAFYTGLAGKMDRPWMAKIFTDFSQEERRHKEKLLAIKEGRFLMPAARKVMDLKIGDYLAPVDPAESEGELDYQKALIIAMQREKKSYKLYLDLAGTTEDENLKKTLLSLAQEEANHKLRFEVEYDDYVLTEN